MARRQVIVDIKSQGYVVSNTTNSIAVESQDKLVEVFKSLLIGELALIEAEGKRRKELSG